MLRAKAGERAEAERGAGRRCAGRRQHEAGTAARLLEHRLNRLLPVQAVALARIEELKRACGSRKRRSKSTLPADPRRAASKRMRARRREAGVRIEQLDREAALCHGEPAGLPRTAIEKVAGDRGGRSPRRGPYDRDAGLEAGGGGGRSRRWRALDDAPARSRERRCSPCPGARFREDDYAGIRLTRSCVTGVVVVQKSRESAARRKTRLARARATPAGRLPDLAKPGWASMAAGLVLLAGGLATRRRGPGSSTRKSCFADARRNAQSSANVRAHDRLDLPACGRRRVTVTLGVRTDEVDAATSSTGSRWTRRREAPGCRGSRSLKDKEGDSKDDRARELVAGLPLREYAGGDSRAGPGRPGSRSWPSFRGAAAGAERMSWSGAARTIASSAAERIGGVREALSFHSGGETPVDRPRAELVARRCH